MKKMNLLAMSLVSAAALSFSSCSNNDDLAGGGTQSQADGVYMTLKISGATSHGTRTGVTADKTTTENGNTDESTITEGMMYIYDGNTCVFRKVITADMFKTAPTQTTAGVTKPIKVAVTGAITTNKAYYVYFLANKTSVDDPIAATSIFTSTTGGADFATEKNFVMFNQNDGTNKAAHSTVTFTDAAKSEATPAAAGEIKLDRVVARIDRPSFAETVTTVTPATDTKTSINVADVVAGISYEGFAVSNLNNNSYVMQNWDANFKTLSVKWGEPKYSLPKSTYGTLYNAEGLANFDTKEKPVSWKYAFENTTTDVNDATAVYFKVKVALTETAMAASDFKDGTFYRYDGRLYTSIKAIFDNAATGEISNPFTETNSITPADVVAKITKDGKLTTDETVLAKFREDYKIEVYRQGVMYYRWAISDNAYKPFVASETTHTYSVLRNSIYRLNVTKVSEIGKDVPNGPEPDDPVKNPNFYMNVTVSINPWVLNAQPIELK
nr:Mfa1 family fimbria major subunit [Prevotella sp.]